MIKKFALLSVIFVFLSSNYNYGMENDNSKLARFEFFLISKGKPLFCAENIKGGNIIYKTALIRKFFNSSQTNSDDKYTFQSLVKFYNNRDVFVNEKHLKPVVICKDDFPKFNFSKKLKKLFQLKPVKQLLTDKLIVGNIEDKYEKVNTFFEPTIKDTRWLVKSCSGRIIGSYENDLNSGGMLNENYTLSGYKLSSLTLLNSFYTKRQTKKEFIEKNKAKLGKKYDLSELKNLDD